MISFRKHENTKENLAYYIYIYIYKEKGNIYFFFKKETGQNAKIDFAYYDHP
jgi:hypothetical protein